MTDLDQFIKMIEQGVGITDVVLFNAARAEIQGEHDELMKFRTGKMVLIKHLDLESQVAKLKEDIVRIVDEKNDDINKEYLEKKQLKSKIEQESKELQIRYDDMENAFHNQSMAYEMVYQEYIKLKSTLDEIDQFAKQYPNSVESQTIISIITLAKRQVAKLKDDVKLLGLQLNERGNEITKLNETNISISSAFEDSNKKLADIIERKNDEIINLQKWKDEQIIVYNDLSREASEYRNDLTKFKSLNILVFLDRMQHDIDRTNLRNGHKGSQAGHQIIGMDHLRKELENLGLEHDENEKKWSDERYGR